MSRSRNTGTPSWAKVDTLPQERRFSERGLIDNVLQEMAQEEADEQKRLAEEDARYMADRVFSRSFFDDDDLGLSSLFSTGAGEDEYEEAGDDWWWD